MDREQAEFERHCGLFRLAPTHYKARFMAQGREFELVGFELKRSKFPFRARGIADGKVLLFTDAIVAAILAKPATQA